MASAPPVVAEGSPPPTHPPPCDALVVAPTVRLAFLLAAPSPLHPDTTQPFHVTVRQAGATGALRGTHTVLWDASRWLSQWIATDPELVRDKTVVELGAGVTGAPSTIAALFAARVTATDLPAAVPQLHDNLVWNLCPGVRAGKAAMITADTDGGGERGELPAACACYACGDCPIANGRVHATVLEWVSGGGAARAVADVCRDVDVVLCGDVVYSETWCALADTLLAVFALRPAAVVLMANTRRTALYRLRRRLVAAGVRVTASDLPFVDGGSEVAWLLQSGVAPTP